MSRSLGRYSPVIYALLRIIVGLLFACHGGQKLFGMFGGMPHPATTMSNIAGVIELVGGFMVALGFLGDWAAFLCSGLMACAYFMVHFKTTPGAAFFPLVNGGEGAVIYCWVFLYIAFHGSGILSLDHLLFRRPATGPAARY